MSKKRILNELHKKIPEKLIEINLDKEFILCENGYDLIPSEVYAFSLKTGKPELKILIDHNYPFKPPYIYVFQDPYKISYEKWCQSLMNYSNTLYVRNSILYKKGNEKMEDKREIYKKAYIFSIIKNPKLNRYWKKINLDNKPCLCCQRLTCSGQWTPNIYLSDILGEYVTRKYFQIFSTRLNIRIINKIFNNDKWDLPEDVIHHIFQFIINDNN